MPSEEDARVALKASQICYFLLLVGVKKRLFFLGTVGKSMLSVAVTKALAVKSMWKCKILYTSLLASYRQKSL